MLDNQNHSSSSHKESDVELERSENLEVIDEYGTINEEVNNANNKSSQTPQALCSFVETRQKLLDELIKVNSTNKNFKSKLQSLKRKHTRAKTRIVYLKKVLLELHRRKMAVRSAGALS